jgi:CYTH domain-containing protein
MTDFSFTFRSTSTCLLASATLAAKNRGVAGDIQSRNGKVSREIERKFLLKRLPPNLRHFHSRTIEQGYLSVKTDGTQIRLRKSGRRHSLTIKRGRGLSRQEIEIDLTRDQFEELWPATAGCRLTKTRYDVPFGKHTIEIDVYRGRNEGLVVAEVEFRDERECQHFEPPEWFAAEVSGKSRYSNVRLARE